MNMRKILIKAFCGLFFLSIFASQSFAQEKKNITLLVGVSNSYNVSEAISEIVRNPEINKRFIFSFFTSDEIETFDSDKKTRETIHNSPVLLVDIMYRGLRHYVADHIDLKKTKVYSLRFFPIDKKGKGFIFDPVVLNYHASPIKENIKNLLYYILKKDCGFDVQYEKPVQLPKTGIFHPDADEIFTGFDKYLKWYKDKGLYKEDGFWVGITDYSRYAAPHEVGKITESLVRLLEENKINVLPIYGYPDHQGLEKFLFDHEGKSRVDILCGLSFKLVTVLDAGIKKNLNQLGIPFLNAIRVSRPVSEWEKSPQGLGLIEMTTRIYRPEFNGLIEPSVLGGLVTSTEKYSGKTVYTYAPVVENIKFFIKRIIAWRNLQTKPNKDKKIAIIYYNHSPGKQNVGASYLNVFRSLQKILKRFRQEGYFIKGSLPSEEDIKSLVLQSGRNIGSWAPGELKNLLATGNIIHLPVSKYNTWYETLPENYREKLEEQWGKPENSDIMIKNNEIIIPCVDLGNIILLPQPSRGWGDDPMKLYHSPLVWPHHQYTAFYLWLKNRFQADAVIHLGRHGTHEWLPGKQNGLSLSCPPEVLIQDLPNIYPYIMDGIGEGLQAKRRGRGVIIDHLTPVFKKSGLFMEYRKLAGLIESYNVSLTKNEKLAAEKLKRVKSLIEKLGIDSDLDIKEINEDAIEHVEHYLIEVAESLIPYGLHSFGLSPEKNALEEMTSAIVTQNDKISSVKINDRLKQSGPLEMEHLINALNGKYVPAGQGNDPIRNPDAIPTGKNFYGFDPKKIPSKEGYILGKKTAEEMINKYLKEKGKYPNKIGIILWSCETERNEGANEATILHLLGMKPVWDKNDRVTGVKPVSGAILQRPRIDVHIQASGLYRDSFPNVILLLDKAVRQASQLRDVENFIAKHSRIIEKSLLEKGYSKNDAAALSNIRIFSAKPGSYGTKIAEVIPNSGFWENDQEIAEVFINQVSFAYGKDIWGKPLKTAYKKNLEDINITMHSRSSNLYMTMDNDDVFQYLGGLSLAVKKISGKYPDVLISRQQDRNNSYIEGIEKTIGKELRTRYLNPKWIEGMKKENYAGAREMADFLENMWGWQVTVPDAVDKTKWEQTYEVYVEDKYGMDLKDFFNRKNPWAYQSITARMLEAVRKDYWQVDNKIKKKLAVEYAVNVVEKGVACCDHTCNNPVLNQMVVNIISLPGVLSPEMVKKFKLAIEQAMGKALAQQIAERRDLHKKLNEGFKKRSIEDAAKISKSSQKQKADPKPGDKTESVEGYKMEKVKSNDETTDLSSSGVQWFASLFIILIIGLFVFGTRRRK